MSCRLCYRHSLQTTARLLRLHQKGGIAKGKDADLVALDDSHRVKDVMVNGKWHVLDGKQIEYGTFEEKAID